MPEPDEIINNALDDPRIKGPKPYMKLVRYKGVLATMLVIPPGWRVVNSPSNVDKSDDVS